DRLDRLEVAGRADREAGLDDVHAEPSELVRDLELLRRVERDARRLLAVAQRRVEDQYSVGIRRGHVVRSPSWLVPVVLRWFAASGGRHAQMTPPSGGGEGEAGRAVRATCLPDSTKASPAGHVGCAILFACRRFAPA